MKDEQERRSADYLGQEWRLPDGQLVKVEEVGEGLAAVRRLDGDRANTITVCRVSELRPNIK
jgi:hypothetical protein